MNSQAFISRVAATWRHTHTGPLVRIVRHSHVQWRWVAIVLLCGSWAGYQAWQGNERSEQLAASEQQLAELRAQSQQEIRALRQALDMEQKKVAAFASSLGLIQARLARLDALGNKLVDTASLNRAEFDFSSLPAVGGVRPQAANSTLSASYLEQMLPQIEQKAGTLSSDLEVLDYLLEHEHSQARARPHAWPTEGGWISSRFGLRADPFTGLPAPHKGVDIANRYGAPVYAAGRGVVVFAGKMSDFGYMVDIDHGFGYVTRYGHLSAAEVQPGDLVEDGQLIGHIGSTGRSTGPHLHYEVHRYGQVIDPRSFLPQG